MSNESSCPLILVMLLAAVIVYFSKEGMVWKIRALHEEYATSLKTLVGNEQLLL